MRRIRIYLLVLLALVLMTGCLFKPKPKVPQVVVPVSLTPEDYEALPGWIPDASSEYTVVEETVGQGKALRFANESPVTSMKWRTPLPEVDLTATPHVTIRYKAESLDLSPPGTFIVMLMGIGPGGTTYINPVPEPIVDGKWHTQKFDLTDYIGYTNTVDWLVVEVRAGTQPAYVSIQQVTFSDVPF